MILITLNRPLVFVQPVAVDRAILFWLSYKNAWEYWTEQRLNLNKEVMFQHYYLLLVATPIPSDRSGQGRYIDALV